MLVVFVVSAWSKQNNVIIVCFLVLVARLWNLTTREEGFNATKLDFDPEEHVLKCKSEEL